MDKNYGYKHTKGFIVFILITIFLCISVANSQVTDSYTSNLINNTTSATTSASTWQNAGTINQPITCWKPSDPGYCGPLPYVNAWGSPNTVNFSYGMTELYQMYNVGKSLPNNGSGLVNTGYFLKFEAKNGNYWDDARQDFLKTQVTLYGPNNSKVLEQHSYDQNYLFNWTYFSYNVNWTTAKLGYRENEVGNVKLSFYGMDNNFWAGPYGPEIRDITFQLKYRPDPCIKNQLFSPECPKFTEELAKANATTTSSDTSSNTANEPLPKDEKETQFAKNTENEKNMPVKDEIYEEGVYFEESNMDLNKLVDTLIKIQDNQLKEEKLTMDASKNAILETDRITQQTVRQAEQLASRASRQSVENKIENNQNTFDTNQRDNRGSQALGMFVAPTTSTFGTFQLPNIQQQVNILQAPNNNQSIFSLANEQPAIKSQQSSIFGNVNNNNQVDPTVIVFAPLQQNSQVNSQNTSSLSSTNSIFTLTNPLANQVIDTPTTSANFLTNKADPINSIIEQKPRLEEKKDDVQTTQVRQNVQDNELATGVPLTQLAVAPVGYNQYMNFVLRDAAFYAPKEIYRNQKTVDNVRALRQLASDRLHQEMVDQQYRR